MTDDKPKRPGSLFPRDRDERVTTAPPKGSELALAQEQLARMRSSPVPRGQFDEAESKTPIGASDYETLAFRAKRAAANSKQALADIAAVRVEFQAADAATSRRLDKVDDRLDSLHGAVAKQSGQLEILVGFAEEAQKASLQTQTMTVTTKLEVEKAQALDPIENKRFWRKLWLSIFGAGGLALAIVAVISQKC